MKLWDLSGFYERTISKSSRIQSDVEELIAKSNQNKFQLNESKCKELRISFAKSAADFAPIVINGKAIEVVSTVKLLGLNISSDLRWNCHVAEISKKVASRLYFLKQLKRANISAKDLLIFYLPGLYPPSNGIRMPRVSQRASRIFIRRARRATEARHANYFSVLYHIATHYIKPTWRRSLDAGSLSQLSFLIPSLVTQTINCMSSCHLVTIVNPI